MNFPNTIFMEKNKFSIFHILSWLQLWGPKIDSLIFDVLNFVTFDIPDKLARWPCLILVSVYPILLRQTPLPNPKHKGGPIRLVVSDSMVPDYQEGWPLM